MLPSHKEELAAFERAFYKYPKVEEILKQIADLHEHGIGPDSAYCMLLVGSSGAGKSALIREYLKDHPEIRGHDRDQIPVLVVEIPSGAKIKSVCQELLMELGDPNPWKGTTTSMMARIHERIRRLGVQMIIFVEFQHLVERRGSREWIAHESADWVKSLLNARLCPILLVGMEDAELVVNANRQLKRRCRAVLRLEAIGFQSKEDRALFRGILNKAQHELPLGLTADLSNLETAQRLHYANEGLVGRLFVFLHDACKHALKESRDCLDSAVFDAVLLKVGLEPGLVNPFRTTTPPVAIVSKLDRTPRTKFRSNGREPTIDSMLRT